MTCPQCEEKDKSCSDFAAMAVESTQRHIEDMRVVSGLKQILIECLPYIAEVDETEKHRGFIKALEKK